MGIGQNSLWPCHVHRSHACLLCMSRNRPGLPGSWLDVATDTPSRQTHIMVRQTSHVGQAIVSAHCRRLLSEDLAQTERDCTARVASRWRPCSPTKALSL